MECGDYDGHSGVDGEPGQCAGANFRYLERHDHGGDLSSLFRRRCTRAEYLFGEGATVNINEAVKARDGNF